MVWDSAFDKPDFRGSHCRVNSQNPGPGNRDDLVSEHASVVQGQPLTVGVYGPNLVLHPQTDLESEDWIAGVMTTASAMRATQGVAQL
jgi:hypothetical protein